MSGHMARVLGRVAAPVAAVVLVLTAAEPLRAEVKKIVVEKKVSPAFDGATFGTAGQYETLAGRAFGELDPNDPHNAIITDIKLAPKNANGKVEYVATFYLVKPVDMARGSRLMWHDVPNRGGRVTINVAERAFGDIGLSSGWQGDNAGRTAPANNNDYVVVPIAKNSDGSPVTGPVLGRIFNASGPDSQTIYVHGNPMPYRPLTLDTTKATLTTHVAESLDGTVKEGPRIPASDWAWAKCSATNPFPGTPDPTQICLKNGFDPTLLYQVVFTAKDPYVLGIGFAAFRDVASFFRNAKQDAVGTPNPVAGDVQWTISRGVSQSGNFLRAFIQLGFTQDEAQRKVYDGAWPIIAGRRIAMNVRFATPDGVLKMYEGGTDGPLWYTPWPDPVRGLPTAGILDRCTKTNTCPKIMEHFGSAEFWDLNLSPSFVGTSADKDIPLPADVRRYYIPSTPHGGGRGGFSVDPLPPPGCPAHNFGVGALAANPVPHTETVNALRVHFRDWVMKNTAPPPSVFPTLSAGYLVDPTKEALGFPTIPGLPPTAPTGLINPVRDYDWGPGFNYVDGSGVPTIVPPTVKRAIKMKAVRVDADGNELGGVPVVLRDAPLGTYLGWNLVSDGFFKGQICNYAGGMIPFATTKAERMASGDPRLSLEERYKNHLGYVDAVKKAAAKAVRQGFLLPADADALVARAAASNVLNPLATISPRSAGTGGAQTDQTR
jgi:Alpha/beta hydrolase domain